MTVLKYRQLKADARYNLRPGHWDVEGPFDWYFTLWLLSVTYLRPIVCKWQGHVPAPLFETPNYQQFNLNLCARCQRSIP